MTAPTKANAQRELITITTGGSMAVSLPIGLLGLVELAEELNAIGNDDGYQRIKTTLNALQGTPPLEVAGHG